MPADCIPELKPGVIYTADEKLEIACGDEGVEVKLRQPALEFHHGFLQGAIAQRVIQPGQSIAKACNNKQRKLKRVLDLTGGWAVDSFTLARHGQKVVMLEHNPLVFSIVDYSLRRFQAIDHSLSGEISLLQINALDYLQSAVINDSFDSIYLDPMFPSHKSSAKPGKDMQILQAITDNCDIDRCFELALLKARNRVVVKRPLKASAIDGLKPDLVYREKTIRFDVYLTGNA